MQCVAECPKTSNSSSFFYLFPEGPDGILSVFCKLNLLAGTFSADWDKLMLRFLKNSNPPLELGSYDYTPYSQRKMPRGCNGLEKLCNSATNLSCRCGWRCLRFSRANGFKKSNHVSTQVPLALFQGCVEQKGGMLPTYCWYFHVLEKQPRKTRIPFILQMTWEDISNSLSPRFPKPREVMQLQQWEQFNSKIKRSIKKYHTRKSEANTLLV